MDLDNGMDVDNGVDGRVVRGAVRLLLSELGQAMMGDLRREPRPAHRCGEYMKRPNVSSSRFVGVTASWVLSLCVVAVLLEVRDVKALESEWHETSAYRIGVSLGGGLLVGDGVAGVETIELRGGLRLAQRLLLYAHVREFGCISSIWSSLDTGIARRRRGVAGGIGLESLQGEFVSLRIAAGLARVDDEWREEERLASKSAWTVPLTGTFAVRPGRHLLIPQIEATVGIHLGSKGVDGLIQWRELGCSLGWVLPLP